MSYVFAIAVTFVGHRRLEGSKVARTHASTELLPIVLKGSTGLGFRTCGFILVILEAFA